MGRLIDTLLRKATRAGLRRGLAGEHWAWLLIAGAAYALRRARRPDARVERIDLRPGDRYLVSLLPRAGRPAGGPASGGPAEVPTGAEDAHRPHPTSG